MDLTIRTKRLHFIGRLQLQLNMQQSKPVNESKYTLLPVAPFFMVHKHNILRFCLGVGVIYLSENSE